MRLAFTKAVSVNANTPDAANSTMMTAISPIRGHTIYARVSRSAKLANSSRSRACIASVSSGSEWS